MKNCLVVGGGLAGLSAAVSLAKKNIHVQLIEASPKFGGRVYSFTDEKSGDEIDNGQHLLLGCYYETLKFLDTINASHLFQYQKNLEINFAARGGQKYYLAATSLPYPFSLLFGLLNYDALSIADKITVILLIARLPFIESYSHRNETVEDWLVGMNQSRNSIKAFWEIIGVGALNSRLKDASAEIFIDILKVIFLEGNDASAMIIPKVGLSKAFINPAVSYIESKKNELSLSEKLVELSFNGSRAVSAVTDKKSVRDFDAVILAIPAHGMSKIKNIELLLEPETIEMKHSSILTLHLWLKENRLKKTFYAFLDSHLHWVFNHGTYLTTVTSGADELIEKSQEELFAIATTELSNHLGIKAEDILDYKIIKEKRATFIPNKENLSKRPWTNTKIENIFLAGDWTNTGLPATIEGAIKSGHSAAREVQKYFWKN